MKNTKTLVSDIFNTLCEWAPLHLAAHWDNCGLQLGELNTPITDVYICLEIDAFVLKHLSTLPPTLVITHHPLFFKALRQIDFSSEHGHIIQQLIKHGHQLISMHTNLDAAPGGVSDTLCAHFTGSSSHTSTFGEGAYARYAHHDTPMPISHFEEKATGHWMGAPKPSQINNVVFGGGSGRSLIQDCIKNNVDLLVTGEIGHHDGISAEFGNLPVWCLGHAKSERYIVPEIAKRLHAKHAELTITQDPR